MSMTTRIAWRNVWRNSRRSLLTMSAIAFAVLLVLFMLAFQFGSYEAMISNAVALSTGHLQVQDQDFMDNPGIRKVVRNPEAVLRVVRTQDGVQEATLRSSSFALMSSEDRTYGGMIMGVDPAAEARVTTLADLVRQGEYLSPDDYDQALVGTLLAQNLGVGLGDEIVVMGQGRDGSFAASVYTVKGLFSSGQDEMDRAFMYVPLDNFQDVFFMQDAVHEVVVKADDLSLVDGLKAAIRAGLDKEGLGDGLAVRTWEELLPGLKQSIQMDLVGGLIFYLLLIIVVAFSILNTFLMAVFERTREFGVMLAMGATPGRLVRLVLLESGFTTLVGIALGTALGIGVTLYFQKHGIPFSGATAEMMRAYGIPERLYPKLTWLGAIIGPVSVLAVTMLSALYPAFRVRRLKPAQAMAAA